MEVYLNGLSKDDYDEIVKVLNERELKQPIIKDVKLQKRYCLGFRVDKLPLKFVSKAYRKEIDSNNSEMEENLKKCIKDYLVRFEGLLDELKTIDDVSNALRWGFDYAESGCDLRLNLVCKVTMLKLPRGYEEIITCAYLRYLNLIKSGKIGVEIAEEERKAHKDELDKLNGRIKTLENEIESHKSKKAQLHTEGLDLSNHITLLEKELSNKDDEIGELRSKISDRDNTNKNLSREVEQQSETITALNQRIRELNEKNNSLQKEIKQITEQYALLEERKGIEYDKAIMKLVTETIEDLKYDNPMSKERLKDIIGLKDIKGSVTDIWNAISSKNIQVVEDVEAALRKNRASLDLIDFCDEIEDYVIAKYIIIKAIKAYLHEQMSIKESQAEINKKFMSE